MKLAHGKNSLTSSETLIFRKIFSRIVAIDRLSGEICLKTHVRSGFKTFFPASPYQ